MVVTVCVAAVATAGLQRLFLLSELGQILGCLTTVSQVLCGNSSCTLTTASTNTAAPWRRFLPCPKCSQLSEWRCTRGNVTVGLPALLQLLPEPLAEATVRIMVVPCPLSPFCQSEPKQQRSWRMSPLLSPSNSHSVRKRWSMWLWTVQGSCHTLKMLKSLSLKYFQASSRAVDMLACISSVFLSCVSVRERKGGQFPLILVG